ncbi:hypothetical protein [Paeniglutamicibacter cryotolerans]|uniref:DUF3618 domain-containing protein n=1 Tax=Paeniglutamicibacter cryotolerans TaxID=670079 RepID=A0A839QNU8_9MICC|nr:hypothetical protein [Paeniglutamicibacter cryotolerans]MBB2996454.1 hypothetical protein [Paeniglutamicibacter cryotolerans]
MEDIQKQLQRWAKKAGQEYPRQLEASLQQAVNHLDPSAISRASEQVVATLTGNHKLARKARESVEDALESAQRKLTGKKPARSRTMFWFGAAVLAAGIISFWAWKATRRTGVVARAPLASVSEQDQSGTHTDPDLSSS